MCAGYTAWSGLRYAEPKLGDRIAVPGIGGLDHVALQFSKALGYETISITHSPDKHMMAKELGADMVVVAGKELLAAGGTDILLVTTNDFNIAEKAMAGVRPDGRIVLCGLDFSKPFHMMRPRVFGSTHGGQHYLTEILNLPPRARSGRLSRHFRSIRPPRLTAACPPER
ncbi:zinc-binding dehydrogenase [Brucella pituitosa]|uniref:zinc-binding dehydrogenase n=1 Tax=Brucella pituitosa TaxID=571256 RepID=UPI00200038D1|nr:zinc-binding dehydrogenase [Brucella pituitosa]